jgi:hypothetical protein
MVVTSNPDRRLTIQRILAWADVYHPRTGKWPKWKSGLIDAAPRNTWSAVDSALRFGHRGLPGGSSLARLLAKERGVRKINRLPILTVKQILAWADAHHQCTGRWPNQYTGAIDAAPKGTWRAVDSALRWGRRGLTGGSSLARLLDEKRGVPNKRGLPPLNIGTILAWADAHHARTGRWPSASSGPVVGVPDETWNIINCALYRGCRDLPGGSTVARLLAKRRGVVRDPLTVPQILAWADAYHERTGEWPMTTSGRVEGTARETWCAIDRALRRGSRGLTGGSSLSALLIRDRGYRPR